MSKHGFGGATEQSHTQGPWRVAPPSKGINKIVTADGLRVVGEASWYCEEARANVRLLAAAPDLLANLEFAVKLLEGMPFFSGTAQVEHMRTVIKQAKGED